MPIPNSNGGPVDCTVVPDLGSLKNKSVIITGGSSGIGAAYVRAFLAAGAHVTNADLIPNDAEAYSAHYEFVKCDVRQWKDQVSVFKSALAKSPRKNVDIVIANAGISGADTVFNLDVGGEPTEPDLTMVDVNYKGVLYTSKLAMHYFSKQPVNADGDRCFIITASLAAYVDAPGRSLYQSSKFAVRGLMCSLRRTGRLRVNVVAPLTSFVDTPLLGWQAPTVKNMIFSSGLDFALPEDCVKATMRIATDTSISGRALGIVPRLIKPEGYLDLEHDTLKEGSILSLFDAGMKKRRQIAVAKI